MKNINVVIVDDEPLIRSTVIETLELGFSDYGKGEIALESAIGFMNGMEFLEYAQQGHSIDVVLLDMEMPELDGVGVLEICKKLSLKYNFILYSGLIDSYYLKATDEYNIKGYIYKLTKNKEELFDSIIAAANGGAHTCKDFFNVLAEVKDYKLTAKELQIAHLTHKGLMEKEIAEVTGINEPAVKYMKKIIKDKLGLNIFKEIFDLLPFNKKSDDIKK